MEKSDVLEVFRTSLKEVPEELAKITKTDNQLNALGYLYYYSPAINHYSLGVRLARKTLSHSRNGIGMNNIQNFLYF